MLDRTNMSKESLDRSRKIFGEPKQCLCSKTYCRYDALRNKFKVDNNEPNQRQLKTTEIAKYRTVLDQIEKVTYTKLFS